jgi:hypothetical protein
MKLYLEPMSDKNRKREEINKLRVWRRKNWEEVREVAIRTRQSLTHNRWRGFGTIFNSPVTYQVLQLVKEKVVITITQTDVAKVNGSTSDGTQQFTQTCSLNIDHDYQEPIEELNTLLLNTPYNTIDAFGTIN